MSDDPARQTRLRVGALSRQAPTAFALEPDERTRAALAGELGANSLRKLRFAGTVAPGRQDDWLLEAHLGVTAVQPCVVTLEPVTTRIDTPVERRFVPPGLIDTPEPGSETEMPEDDSVEPLGAVIDLEAILAEALALALPAFPREQEATLGEAVYADDGVTPLRDTDLKPLSGLAALRERMREDGDDG